MANIEKDLNYWINVGKEMTADREKRVNIARQRKFDTIATHGVYDLNQALSLNSGSIMEPIYLSTAQAYEDSAQMEAGLSYQMPNWCYSRIANPSNFFLEETAALLETYGLDIHASCCATASGMSAIRTATEPFLSVEKSSPKPNFVACAKVYGGTFQQFSVRRNEEQGIEVRWVTDPSDINSWAAQIDNNTRFVYGEFPTNPSVTIFDIEKVAQLVHSHNIPLIVDSTCASPALTRPLVHGADIVVQSATKVMGASGTSIAGLLIARKNLVSKFGSDEMKADFATWVKFWPYRDNGPSLSPFSAIMLLNDIRSLRMRVRQMSESALKVATWLQEHPKIESVSYPGLESYPDHALARKYMKLADTQENMYGYMMSVNIAETSEYGSENARTFYDALNMIWRATDLGRVKTVATLSAISTHQQQGEEGRALAQIKPSTCRIAIGIEHPDDIIADLGQALDAIKTSRTSDRTG